MKPGRKETPHKAKIDSIWSGSYLLYNYSMSFLNIVTDGHKLSPLHFKLRAAAGTVTKDRDYSDEEAGLLDAQYAEEGKYE